MKAALVLLLVSMPAAATCDWRISSDRTDPMTDQRVCIISSSAAKIGFGVYPDRVMFLTRSAYAYRDGLQVRIDDAPAIYLTDKARSTDAFEHGARDAYAQILTGKRLRTSYRDYPQAQEGDAEICNLPALIQSCRVRPTR